MPARTLKTEEDYVFFKDELINASKINFLSKLDEYDTRIKYDLNITEWNNAEGKPKANPTSNLVHAKLKSEYLFEVKNNNQEDLYVYLLNIRPNKVIYLFKSVYKNEKIKQGETADFAIQFNDLGFDQYLLITSFSKLNLDPFVDAGKEMKSNSEEISHYQNILGSRSGDMKAKGSNKQGVTTKLMGVNVSLGNE